MPDPTGENYQIPPWILPYVRPSQDSPALSAKTSVVLTAIVQKQIASFLADARIRRLFQVAAAKFISAAIDDCGNSGPRLPRHIGFLEAASQLARLGEATQNKGLREDLEAAASELFERARTAVKSGR